MPFLNHCVVWIAMNQIAWRAQISFIRLHRDGAMLAAAEATSLGCQTRGLIQTFSGLEVVKESDRIWGEDRNDYPVGSRYR